MITNIVAIALSILAFFLLKPEEVVIGLAVAFALSYWVGLFVTDLLLRRFTGTLLLAAELPFYFRVSVVAALAVLFASFTQRALDLEGNLSNLLFVLATTTIAYLLLARLARIREVSETIKTVFRR